MPNTRSKEVNLTRRVQTGKGMRLCPVVLSSKGRIKPDFVLVSGETERHPEGASIWNGVNGAGEVRLSVGKDAHDAAARQQRKQAELNALNNCVRLLPENSNGHVSLATAVADFSDETKLTKKPKTLAAGVATAVLFAIAPVIQHFATDARDARRYTLFQFS